MLKKQQRKIVVFLLSISSVFILNCGCLTPANISIDAGKDITIYLGECVTFEGNVDSKYQISSYQWDFNNDKSIDWESNKNDVARYTYSEPGHYIAVFTVIYGSNESKSDSCVVSVSPEPPLILNIHCEKLNYSLGEKINITVDIKNVKNESLNTSAPRLDLNTLDLNIETSEKEIIHYIGPLLLMLPFGITIDGGKTYSTQITIDPDSKYWGTSQGSYNFTKTGMYNITCEYASSAERCIDKTVWSGVLYSENLAIELEVSAH